MGVTTSTPESARSPLIPLTLFKKDDEITKPSVKIPLYFTFSNSVSFPLKSSGFIT